MSQYADLVHKTSGSIKREGQVRFASVEWGANEDLCKSQGIETVPTTRIYVSGRLVEEITVQGPKDFPRVQETVEELLNDQKLTNLNKDLAKTLRKGSALLSQILETTTVVSSK